MRVSDLATGAPVGGPFTCHTARCTSVAAAELGRPPGRDLRQRRHRPCECRTWPPAPPSATRSPATPSTVTAVAAASSTAARSSSPAATTDRAGVGPGHRRPVGGPFTGHTGAVNAVAAAELDGRPVAVTAGERRDGAGVGPGHRRPGRRPVHRPRRYVYPRWRPPSWMAARWSSPAAATRRCGCGTWPPAPRSAPRSPATPVGYRGGGGELDGCPVVISGGSDRRCGSGTWPPAPRSAARSPATPTGYAVSAAELDGRPVVVSGGYDQTVRVWDLATGAPVGDPFTGHTDGGAVAAAELDGRPVVHLRQRRRHGAALGPRHAEQFARDSAQRQGSIGYDASSTTSWS